MIIPLVLKPQIHFVLVQPFSIYIQCIYWMNKGSVYNLLLFFCWLNQSVLSFFLLDYGFLSCVQYKVFMRTMRNSGIPFPPSIFTAFHGWHNQSPFYNQWGIYWLSKLSCVHQQQCLLFFWPFVKPAWTSGISPFSCKALICIGRS